MKDQIKQANELVEFAGEFLDIKQVGGIYQAMCFGGHDKKSPSLTVYPKTQSWHCYGCKQGGDVISLAMQVHNVSFEEALTMLAKRAGIAFSSISVEDIARFKEEGMIQEVLHDTAMFYHKSLNDEASSYLLKRRGLTEEIVEQFMLGVSYGGLSKHLLEELKHPLDLCLKAGVIRKGESGETHDYFLRRIIIPNICFGRVVHMSGRLLGEGEPKYIHLPGGINHLYNESALSQETVYLAEGQTDALTLIQNGYNAAGVMGANNFKEQWVKRFSKCKTVYIVFDGDKAGKDGAFKVARMLGSKARIVSMPEGMDVNEFFR